MQLGSMRSAPALAPTPPTDAERAWMDVLGRGLLDDIVLPMAHLQTSLDFYGEGSIVSTGRDQLAWFVPRLDLYAQKMRSDIAEIERIDPTLAPLCEGARQGVDGWTNLLRTVGADTNPQPIGAIIDGLNQQVNSVPAGILQLASAVTIMPPAPPS